MPRQPHPSSPGCISSTGSAFDDRVPCARSRARRRRPIARSRSASSQRRTLPRATSSSRTLATSACPCPRLATSTSTRASSELPGGQRAAGEEGAVAQQPLMLTSLQTHLVAHGSLDSDREGARRKVSVFSFHLNPRPQRTVSDRPRTGASAARPSIRIRDTACSAAEKNHTICCIGYSEVVVRYRTDEGQQRLMSLSVGMEV